MKRFLQIAVGAVIVALGLMLLVVMLRSDQRDASGQAFLGPLSLIGVGAFAISAARKRKR